MSSRLNFQCDTKVVQRTHYYELDLSLLSETIHLESDKCTRWISSSTHLSLKTHRLFQQIANKNIEKSELLKWTTTAEFLYERPFGEIWKRSAQLWITVELKICIIISSVWSDEVILIADEIKRELKAYWVTWKTFIHKHSNF